MTYMAQKCPLGVKIRGLLLRASVNCPWGDNLYLVIKHLTDMGESNPVTTRQSQRHELSRLSGSNISLLSTTRKCFCKKKEGESILRGCEIGVWDAGLNFRELSRPLQDFGRKF